MNEEKFFEELETLKDARRQTCEEIKSHGKPVIIFGAGEMAQPVTDELTKFDVEIDGYAVDEKYYKPEQNYLGRPVYKFSELSAEPEKYIFVLGLNDEGGRRSLAFLLDKKLKHYAVMPNLSMPITYEWIVSNRRQLTETFNWLEDDLSRRTMRAYLKQKISRDPSFNIDICQPNSYFNDLINGGGPRGSYIDCGAYRGDTIEKFIEWSGGAYEKILGVEADPINYAALEKFIRTKDYKNVATINCGVWNEQTTLTFDGRSNTSSTISEGGDVTIRAERIDDLVGEFGLKNVRLIKMDIEGSELNALKGAVETIGRDNPDLAVCVYHRTEDLITIPQFIKNLRADYKFYLRKHTFITDVELVLYAIA